jgi:hypothetical protein
MQFQAFVTKTKLWMKLHIAPFEAINSKYSDKLQKLMAINQTF